MEKTVLFYSAGPYGPLGRQLATRAAHELCRNATALHVERSLAQTMAASWRASAGAIVLLGGAGMVAEGSHAGAASSIVPTDAARVEVALQRERIRELRRAGRGAVRGDGGRARAPLLIVATPPPLGAREDAVERAGRHARSAAVRIAAEREGARLLDLSAALRPVHYEPGGVALNEIGVSLALALVAAVLDARCGSRCDLARRRPVAPVAAPARAPADSAGGAAQAERAGVCLSGWMGVSVEAGGASIRTKLLEPLGAELLLALTHHARDGCTSVEACGVAARLHALEPFAAIDLQPMLKLEQLVATLEALPHWERVLRAHNTGRRVSCERVAGWRNSSDGAPYRCVGIYMGNTYLAPVLGSARLNVLRQLHDIRRCLALVESRELAAGRRYSRLVHSRLETVWLRPHPPLELLERAAVWIPSGEDYYGGWNDRHAVLSREAAEIYMRRWDFIVGGEVLWIDPQMRRAVVDDGLRTQDENLVRNVLEHFHLGPARRFPAVQYLGCCVASTAPDAWAGRRASRSPTACFSRACVERAIPSDDVTAAVSAAAAAATAGKHPAAAPAVAAPSDAAIVGQPTLPIRGKYRSEVEQAVHHALALALPGARYRVRARPDAGCGPVEIVAPAAHAGAFKALLTPLKRRAFRKQQSEYLVFTDSP